MTNSPGLGAQGRKSQARRQHHGLLRTRHLHVDPPGIHGQLIASQGRDRVHDQNGARAGFGHRGQFLHRVGYAGGGLVGLDHDRFDLRMGIQDLGHGFGVHRPAPFHRQAIHLDPVHIAQFGPALAELAAVHHQGRIPGGQGVGHRPFHGAGAGGGEHEHFLLRFEQIFQTISHLRQDLHKLG